jgi:ubiquinone/menaquinone biosynthesis C-methylase UbiE
MLHNDILRFAASVNTGYLHSFGKKATLAFLQLLQPQDGEQLLELGCGTGFTTAIVLASRKVSVCAVETKPEMLAAAESNVRGFGFNGRCKFYQAFHGKPLSFADKSFDKVYWEGVLALQSTGDFDFFLLEVHRLLKDGGICVMNETLWLKDVPQQLVDDWNKYNEEQVNLRSSTQLNWCVNDWLQHFKTNGFEVERNLLIKDAIDEIVREINPAENVASKLAATVWLSRIKKAISPKHALSNWQLKRKLARFKDVPQVLEARFFVLRKINANAS